MDAQTWRDAWSVDICIQILFFSTKSFLNLAMLRTRNPLLLMPVAMMLSLLMDTYVKTLIFVLPWNPFSCLHFRQIKKSIFWEITSQRSLAWNGSRIINQAWFYSCSLICRNGREWNPSWAISSLFWQYWPHLCLEGLWSISLLSDFTCSLHFLLNMRLRVLRLLSSTSTEPAFTTTRQRSTRMSLWPQDQIRWFASTSDSPLVVCWLALLRMSRVGPLSPASVSWRRLLYLHHLDRVEV